MDGSRLVSASCRTALKSPFPPFLPLRPASACIPYPARIERWRRALRDPFKTRLWYKVLRLPFIFVSSLLIEHSI